MGGSEEKAAALVVVERQAVVVWPVASSVEVSWEVRREAVVPVVAGWEIQNHMQPRYPAGTLAWVEAPRFQFGTDTTGVNHRHSTDSTVVLIVGRSGAAGRAPAARLGDPR